VSRSTRKSISEALTVPVLLLTAALLPGALSAQAVSPAVDRVYIETHGASVSTVEYRQSRDGQSIVLDSAATGSSEEIRWTPDVGTTEWKVKDPAAGNDFQAVRTADIIHATGVLKGKPVDRQVKVDRSPWYQIFGPLLQELLPTGFAQREFWVVDPSDLAPHKMQVRRAGTERVTVRGTALDAAKFHFSPAGALAPFWGADFWYRQSDGLWVTSRLPENGGVTVSTVKELVP